MNTYQIDGRAYADILRGGASVLSKHINELNELNVFPVADGDTGTNMLSTVKGGLSALSSCDDGLDTVAKSFADSSLLSARGNSGVILSQIFMGIGEGLNGLKVAGARELAEAFKKGIVTSYSAVQNPTEGTILTVFRESVEYASSRLSSDATLESFFELLAEEARRSLDKTPELLPALAEAGVVDSGAAGYVFFAEGMLSALAGEISVDKIVDTEDSSPQIDVNRFTRDSKLEFGYCTEFLLRLTTDRVDPDSFDVGVVLEDLKRLSGESVVAFKNGDIVKVHVHTFDPGSILSKMQSYGEFLTVKIENMSLGHSGSEKKKSNKGYSTVTVSSGEGITALFKDMGADFVINGGQTDNPSIDDFLKAFSSCDGENIIVLPNNKNIILAAEQAAKIYEAARVFIVPTKNILQGYSALSVINPGIKDIDTLVSGATRAAEGVIDCEITRAIRDVNIDGKHISKGDYMAISQGSIRGVSDTAEDAAMLMLECEDTDLCEILTVFVGREVTDESRVSLTERIQEAYPDLEVVVYNGDQPVYDYLIAIE